MSPMFAPDIDPVAISIGPLNERVLEETVLPLIARLRRGPVGDSDVVHSTPSVPQE